MIATIEQPRAWLPLESPDAGRDVSGDLSAVPSPGRRPVVLVVDDDLALLDLIRRILEPYSRLWESRFFCDPLDAWTCLCSSPVDAVISDVKMPGLTGFELLRRIRDNPDLRDTPVALFTATAEDELKNRALDCGATDLLNKPFHQAELLARLGNMLRLKAMLDAEKRSKLVLERTVETRTRELRRSRLNIIWKLAKAAEFRDPDTGAHIVRVAQWSAAIAGELGWPSQKIEEMSLAAPLHDVGKIAIPDSILLKPGRFTPAERRVMETHCELGHRILTEPGLMEAGWFSGDLVSELPSRSDPLIDMAAEIALSHHERWDGHGYPGGLAGDAIPLTARIVAVADVYDALISARPYKAAMSDDEATEVIAANENHAFDARVVGAFLRVKAAVGSAVDSLLPPH